MKDIRQRLSTLWIVIMFNMLFADVLAVMLSKNLTELLNDTGPVVLTEGLLFTMAFLIEIPILMIFFSRFLKYKINRVLNIIAAVITILFVTVGASSDLQYLFFMVVEVLCSLAIIKYAWNWKEKNAK